MIANLINQLFCYDDMMINEKRFNFVYFGLFSILIIFAVYTAIDFLPSFAISSTIITPNDSSCQYEGPYNHTTGIFQCAIIPQGSNQTIPQSWSSPSNQYPSSYNSNTGITYFSNFPSNNIQSHLNSYDYIINYTNGFSLAQNTKTGLIDYNSTDLMSILQSIDNTGKTSNVFIMSSQFYQAKSDVVINHIALIQGSGMNNTTIIRNYNANSEIFNVYSPITKINDLTVNGNCLANTANTQSEEITFRGLYNEGTNLNVINFNHIGIGLVNGKLHYPVVHGNFNCPLDGMGIWFAVSNANVVLDHPYVDNTKYEGISIGGIFQIDSPIVRNTNGMSQVGGGQIAIYTTALHGIISDFIIDQSGNGKHGFNNYTDGIEIGGSGSYIINPGYIYNVRNGIDIDGGVCPHYVILPSIIQSFTRLAISNGTSCGHGVIYPSIN